MSGDPTVGGETSADYPVGQNAIDALAATRLGSGSRLDRDAGGAAETDDGSFDALVASDAAEFAPPSTEPVPAPVPEPDFDAADLIVALRDAVEMAEVWAIGGVETPEGQVRILAALTDAAKRLTATATAVSLAAAPDLDGPVVIDGRVWVSSPVRTVTGWQKDRIKSKVTAAAVLPKLDEATGEVRDPTPDEVVTRMWTFTDVAVGRTAVLRDKLDVTADEYATVDWVTKIVERKL